MSRIGFVVSAIALLVMFSASDAHAGRYRNAKLRVRKSTQQTAPQYVYPRVRQLNGKTLWDLGKQNGQWPPF